MSTEQLYIYPCEWNYRPDHCMYMSVCKGGDADGANILHGSRRVMHNDKQPAFKATYDTFKKVSTYLEVSLHTHDVAILYFSLGIIKSYALHQVCIVAIL